MGRERLTVDGHSVTYLVLSIRQRGWGTLDELKVSVPEDRARSLGVRSAISKEEAADVA